MNRTWVAIYLLGVLVGVVIGFALPNPIAELQLEAECRSDHG